MGSTSVHTDCLRAGLTVALLAFGGCAAVEPVEPTRASRGDTNATALAEPTAGANSDEPSRADTSEVRSRPEATVPTEKASAAPPDVAADADESRNASGRRLTLRQKRIFVLGLAAHEKK